jgi:hypothetical protein
MCGEMAYEKTVSPHYLLCAQKFLQREDIQLLDVSVMSCCLLKDLFMVERKSDCFSSKNFVTSSGEFNESSHCSVQSSCREVW